MAAAMAPVKLADGTEPSSAPGKPVSYGFGWFLDPHAGRARMWHSGSTTGFRTIIDRFTMDQLTVIILANRTDLDVDKLALQVADDAPPRREIER
jgi:hypothetical protein